MTDDNIVVLGRKPGPTEGLTTVAVANGTHNALTVVINTRDVGTPKEQQTLRIALEKAREAAEAIEGGE